MATMTESEQEEMFRLRAENTSLRQQLSVLTARNANLVFFAGRQYRVNGDGNVSEIEALEQYRAEHPTGDL
jgi:hypothetical protein